MQIELAPEIAKAILAEAEAMGLTPDDVANRHLAALASVIQDGPSPFRNSDEARAWMLSRNPNMPEHSPDIDWQAVKAEGRRY